MDAGFDRAAYLRRIDYNGPTTVSLDTLRALHRAHLFHVPFENLDIVWERDILCDEQRFIQKILGGRGGFCYELNGSFAALLRDLGFNVTLLSARVPRSDGSDSPEFDHLTLRVDLEEPWLADVGFGDCFIEPLRLRAGLDQVDGNRAFRLSESEGNWLLQMAEQAGIWRDEYRFTLKSRALSEFEPMCYYHQTSTDSHFTRNRICSIAKPWGRVTLTGDKLITTRNGDRIERLVSGEEEWETLLEREFGIAR